MYKKLMTMQLLFLLSLFSLASAAMEGAEREDLGDGLYLYKALEHDEAPAFVALATHGFDVKPELLEPHIRELNTAGIPTVLVSLSGHRPNTVMNYTQWESDLNDGINMVTALYPQSKIVLFGHSLGGAMASIVASQQEQGKISKLILLAPANGLKSLASIVLKFVPQLSFINANTPNETLIMMAGLLGGAFPQLGQFLGQAGTIICGENAYSEKLSLQDFAALAQAHKNSSSELFKTNLKAKKINTLVIVDQKDGLVDSAKLENIFDFEGCHVDVRDTATNAITAHTFSGGVPMNDILDFIFAKEPDGQ